MHVQLDVDQLLGLAFEFRIVEVSAEIKRDSVLHLSVEEQIQCAEQVRLPAAVRADDRDDVVQAAEIDPRQRTEVLDAYGADEVDLGTLVVDAAAPAGSPGRCT